MGAVNCAGCGRAYEVPADWVEVRCPCGQTITPPKLPLGSIPHTAACFALALAGSIAVAAALVLGVAAVAVPNKAEWAVQLGVYSSLPIAATAFWVICKLYAAKFPGKVTLPTRHASGS